MSICLFKSGVLEPPVGLEVSSGESVTSWASTIHHGRLQNCIENPYGNSLYFSPLKYEETKRRNYPVNRVSLGLTPDLNPSSCYNVSFRSLLMTDEQHRTLSHWAHKTPPVMVGQVLESCLGPPAWLVCLGWRYEAREKNYMSYREPVLWLAVYLEHGWAGAWFLCQGLLLMPAAWLALKSPWLHGPHFSYMEKERETLPCSRWCSLEYSHEISGKTVVNHRCCDHHTPSDRQLRLFTGQASASHHNNCSS